MLTVRKTFIVPRLSLLPLLGTAYFIMRSDNQEDHDPDLRGDPGDHPGVHTGQLAGLVLRTGPVGRQEQRTPPSPPSSALSPHCPPRRPRGSRPLDRRPSLVEQSRKEIGERPTTLPDNNPSYPLPASDGKDKGPQDKDSAAATKFNYSQRAPCTPECEQQTGNATLRPAGRATQLGRGM
ncbi:hypothetical protein MRX96_034144 [Rhipicephalus microplus]